VDNRDRVDNRDVDNRVDDRDSVDNSVDNRRDIGTEHFVVDFENSYFGGNESNAPAGGT